MKKLLLGAIFIIATTLIVVLSDSCKHVIGQCNGGGGKTSGSGEHSHNSGKNCLSCHYSGGEGDGCFTLGGTVYDSLQLSVKTGGTMKLFTGPNGSGDMVLSLAVDSRGNFYTGGTINFIGGLYPAITNKSGQTKYMGSAIKLGSCASCHGNSTGKIWVP